MDASTAAEAARGVRKSVQLLQNILGAFLACSGDGALYLCAELCEDAHWSVQQSSGMVAGAGGVQTIQSASHPSFFLASDRDSMHVRTITVAPKSKQPAELAHPEIRWRVRPAMLQARMLLMPSSASSSGALSEAFLWLSPEALCAWRSAEDASSAPPQHAIPYASIGLMQQVAGNAQAPFPFELQLHAEAESALQRLILCAESAWQRQVWMQALVNTGVPTPE